MKTQLVLNAFVAAAKQQAPPDKEHKNVTEILETPEPPQRKNPQKSPDEEKINQNSGRDKNKEERKSRNGK